MEYLSKVLRTEVSGAQPDGWNTILPKDPSFVGLMIAVESAVP